MPRLNERAFQILHTEVLRCTGDNPLYQAQREVVLRRLERLRSQQGSPADATELRELIFDLLPNFSESALQSAARANRPSLPWGAIKFASMFLVGTVGGLYILNLPYPMIRWPVARVAPILLLPSFISMDHHYRQAIALVEQADQLVNQATGPADLDLGQEKVKQASQHLDALPVWFLGYYPRYGFWTGWQFTLDEFKTARANIGRMEAKLFQEKNAQTLLSEGEQALNTAKQQYQRAQTPTEKAAAIADWQAAIDKLQQIPAQTLAGKEVKTRLVAYLRDYQQIAGLAVSNTRSGNLMAAAKQFAMTAAQSAQNPPHRADEWTEIISFWSQAIERVQGISVDDPNYLEAQKLLVTYQKSLSLARLQLKAEQESVAALEFAQANIESLLATNTKSTNRGQVISQIQAIINQLEKVRSGTTAYAEAQELLQSAQRKLSQLAR